MANAMNSLIIPVFKNEDNIKDLIAALVRLNKDVSSLEVVFVVDGSPDASAEMLEHPLPETTLKSQLLVLSRNFGSFSAIRAGLIAAEGSRFAVMAADLQEPPELVSTFFQSLEHDEADVILGVRESRNDPFFSKLLSGLYWSFYRRFVVAGIPKGGVDVFACNQSFRDKLLELDESHSSMVALLFWMGFRKKFVPYNRLERIGGKSAWTFKKKYTYFKDSIFSFTDIPIRLLTWAGTLGIVFSLIMAILVLIAKISNWVDVPGYSATILTIIFFGALNLFGIGIIGTYAWRTYENTKKRPSHIVMKSQKFSPN